MLSLIPQFVRPQCLKCLRRVIVGFSEGSLQATRQHLRGKKKLAKSQTIIVRLLADIPRYGRQGAIIPVAPGRMRNILLPKRLAEYVTVSQIRELGMADAVFERDITFGVAQLKKPVKDELEKPIKDWLESPAGDVELVEKPISVETVLLKPELVIKLISTLLPPRIDFYRSPKMISSPTPPQRSPSLPAISAISAAAQEALDSKLPQKIEIYGSVTTADIIDNVKAILAQDIEGVRVVLNPEDIKILEKGEATDRIKHIGEFEVVIGNKGTTEEVRRTIKVSEQEKV